MKLFLTSSSGGSYLKEGKRYPCALDNRNHYVDNLRRVLPDRIQCLMISSDPENDIVNDSIKKIMTEAFEISGFQVSKTEMCDSRNCNHIASMIAGADLIILCGGHVPTQNKFFEKINLNDLLKNYKGVIVGISAGTMNCAALVYAQPELEGEAIDPNYQRFISGLGLTEIRILPHFQELSNLTLDGLDIIGDIALADSKVYPFYALTDGAYICIEDDKINLYGEAYYFDNGEMVNICKEGQTLPI